MLMRFEMSRIWIVIRLFGILETIISLGGKLGMEVITEGVETDKQLLMLTEMGCHIFQGYYFSKPIPVEEFEQKYMNE